MRIEEIKLNFDKDLSRYEFDKKKSLAASLIVEEILLLYSPASEHAAVEIKRNKEELYAIISIPGEKRTLRSLEEDKDSFFLDHIKKDPEMVIEYRYSDNTNIVILKLNKRFTFYNNIKFIFSFLTTEKRNLIIACVCHLIAVLANIMIPYFTGKLTGYYTGNSLKQIIYTAIAILAARTIYFVFFALANANYNIVSLSAAKQIKTEMLRKVLVIQDDQLASFGYAQLVDRINNDSGTASSNMPSLFGTVANFMYYFGVLFVSVLFDRTVFFIELITLVGLYLLEKKRIDILDINHKVALRCKEQLAEIVHSVVAGAGEIKFSGAKEYMIEQEEDFAQKQVDAFVNANVVDLRHKTGNNLYNHILYCITLLYLGFAIYNSKLTLSTALILFNYFTIINMPMANMIQTCMDLSENFFISSERIYKFIYGNEFETEKNGTLKMEALKGNIDFNHVTFSYHNQSQSMKACLNGLNFSIKAGTSTAIVGKSGEGKTTILKLLSGQLDVIIGNITIDGIDISRMDKDVLRQSIAYVNQFPFLFNVSIKDNLRMARLDAGMDEIEDACKRACIYEDIMQTENGFDTVIKENGNRFSGGQKQRIAIARALLKGSKILILDEATSALDNITQREIMRNIRELGNEYTIIIVANRLSTIAQCDKIIVLSGGYIENIGTHDELVITSPTYRALTSVKESEEES